MSIKYQTIAANDLATLRVRHIIFHDVPNNARGGTNKPMLADAVTELDAPRRAMLKERLAQVLGSKAAYPVQFLDTTGSPVPEAILEFTARSHSQDAFVELSRNFAQYLFEQQGGAMSPGLLCVIDVVTAGHSGLAILKLEREKGAELELKETDGERSFEMAVLDNLVLTDGTRLFKAAIFVRAGAHEIRAAVCDGQRTVVTSSDVARFWMRFLGCRVTEEPRVTTQKWFDVTVRFVNEYISDPVAKNDVYEHLVSELKSNRATVSPKRFVEDYVPDEYRKPYLEFVKESGVSLHQFEKDLSDLGGKLRRRSLHTIRGVTVTVPVDEPRLVDIEAEQIVVHDRLQTVVDK